MLVAQHDLRRTAILSDDFGRADFSGLRHCADLPAVVSPDKQREHLVGAGPIEIDEGRCVGATLL